jgi:type I restriction enzyme S subunit
MSSKTKTTAAKEEATPELVPKRRFPEFRDAEGWASKKIGSMLIESPRPIELEDEVEYCLVTVKRRYGGLVSRGNLKGKEIKVNNQFLVHGGDFLISKRQIVHDACGLVPEALDGSVVSNEYSVLTPRAGCSIEFFNWFAQQPCVSRSFLECSVGIVIEKMLFKLPSWLKREFLFPPFPEQQKIAECLSSVDELIAAQARKLEALKTHKQGLMQQLFPREGETQPRLRFPEFQNAGAWADDTLGAVCELYQPVTLSSSELSMTGEHLVYGANGIIGTHHEYNHEENEIAVTCRGATCGEVTNTKPKSWITGNAMVVKPRSKKLRKEFIFHYFKNHGLKTVISGSAQPQITRTGFAPLVIFFPQPEEQERIGLCLGSLDSLITAETQRLEALKTHKKGLMHQLFPSPEGPNP